MKIYMAISKRSRKVTDRFGIESEKDDLFRTLAEMDKIKKYDVAEFDLNKVMPTRNIRSKDSAYWDY